MAPRVPVGPSAHAGPTLDYARMYTKMVDKFQIVERRMDLVVAEG